MKSSTRFFGVAGSAALFAVVGIVGFVANLKVFADKFRWSTTLMVVLALTGIALMINMWIYYEKALRESQSAVTPTDPGPILGPPRENADFQNKALTMIRKPGVREIDVGGLALRSPYFRPESAFKEQLLKMLKADSALQVRVWLLDPKSIPLKLREVAEGVAENRLRATCTESLETLKQVIQEIWSLQQRRRPEVVLIDKIPVTHSIFRVDDEMWVTFYLQQGTGSQSPIVHLTSKDYWFGVYKKQFESCFRLHSGNLYPTKDELDDPRRSRAVAAGL